MSIQRLLLPSNTWTQPVQYLKQRKRCWNLNKLHYSFQKYDLFKQNMTWSRYHIHKRKKQPKKKKKQCWDFNLFLWERLQCGKSGRSWFCLSTTCGVFSDLRKCFWQNSLWEAEEQILIFFSAWARPSERLYSNWMRKLNCSGLSLSIWQLLAENSTSKMDSWL